MTYRDDLAALAARHDALASEVAHKTRELDQTSQLLEDAKARARLPVLDNIRVASPCGADWAKMAGDARSRHCGDCQKTVYNLSDLTRDEAEALIIEKEGRLCVRYFERADGTILLKDCTVGIAKKRKRRIIAAGAVALLAGGAVLALRSESRDEAEDERTTQRVGTLIDPQVTIQAPAQVTVTPQVAPPAQTPVKIAPHVQTKMGVVRLHTVKK
ncbi:MAG: hypothetical protein ABI867_30230 [Kofleriaceae bacterium]